MRRYRVLLPILVDGEHGQGDEFSKDLSEEEETESLKSGLLEIVPATYRVVGESRVFETDPGDTFMAALTVGRERILVDGGFIEPVPAEAAESPKPKNSKKKKEG